MRKRKEEKGCVENGDGMQWRRNYGDRGVQCTPQVQDLYPLYPKVKYADYVKILSKRL